MMVGAKREVLAMAGRKTGVAGGMIEVEEMIGVRGEMTEDREETNASMTDEGRTHEVEVRLGDESTAGESGKGNVIGIAIDRRVVVRRGLSSYL